MFSDIMIICSLRIFFILTRSLSLSLPFFSFLKSLHIEFSLQCRRRRHRRHHHEF